MSSDLIFFLGLSLLLCHEMDAVKHHEWRMLPLTSGLSDRAGYHAFTWAHVPLYLLLLWALGGAEASIRSAVIVGLNLFFIVHTLLHIALRRHPAYEFSGLLSWSLIVGAGLCGVVDLGLRLAALR